jgi:hypothetical protein
MRTAPLSAVRQPRRVAPPTSDEATAPRRDSRAAQRGETLPPSCRLDRSAVPARPPFYARQSRAVSTTTRNRKPRRRLSRTAACLFADHRHTAQSTRPVANKQCPDRAAPMPAPRRNKMGKPRRTDTPPGFGVRLGPAHSILPRRLTLRVTARAAPRILLRASGSAPHAP